MSPTPDNPKEAALALALEQFAAADTPMQQRRDALSVLIAEKYLPKQADAPEVSQGRAHLERLARPDPGHAPTDQLQAIAELMRLSQVVKRWLPDTSKLLEQALVPPLAPMALLADADDRLNLARACSLVKQPWLASWLAMAIATEDTGEKARAELLNALLLQTDSLAAALKLLAHAFTQVRPETETPGDTVARRLTRTLVLWRTVLRDSEMAVGQGLGQALYELLALPLSEMGKPQSTKVRNELCEQALLTVHDSVRSRVSLAADPDIYQVASYCKRLFDDRKWPASLSRPLERLIADVSEIIILLGRQGQRDQGLLEQFQVLTSNATQAKAIARTIVSANPELPEPVRDWLEHGRIRQTQTASASAQESAQANADSTIGLALQSTRQLRQQAQQLVSPLMETLELYEPTLLPAARNLLDTLQASAILLEQIAAQRSVGLLGAPGEEVEVIARFFDIVSGQPRQYMTVKQPAVVRLRPNNTPGEVLMRGLVE